MDSVKKNEPKLTIRQIIKNVKYVLSYAVKLDRFLVVVVILTFIICGLIFAVVDTLFLKLFIDFLQDTSKSLAMMIAFVFVGVLSLGLGMLLDVVVSNWAHARMIRITGQVQADLIHKAAKIDLICYDHKEYFDDFVLAASQAEEMIIQGIFSTAQICGDVTTIITLAVLITTIHPVIAIFPVLGFLVNIITRFQITKLEYEFELEEKKIMRKADYSKRIFYQPEYAKELKMSDVDVPLKKQMNEAIGEIQGKAKTIGIKIAVLSLINWIVVFTLLFTH